MGELLNCPFCGSGIDNSTPTPFPSSFAGPRREFVVEWAARCGNPYCGAEVNAGSAKECAERWNRRATHPQPVTPAGGEVDHELQQKWFRAGWDMYVNIHGDNQSILRTLADWMDDRATHWSAQAGDYAQGRTNAFCEAAQEIRDHVAALNQRGGGE